ncbi:mannose-6-phosphate isomerase [Spirochaetia bacterium]|nr:mannose-6-phosphate isomerase [Spirochaetia bacterium]
MAKTDLHIETLGASFSIAADEDAAYLKKLLDDYLAAVEKTKKTIGLKDPLKIAILTGFLLVDELHKLKNAEQKTRAKESREAQELALNLIARIDEALDQCPMDEQPPARRLFKLKNTVKHYGWGSPARIPSLLGEKNPEGLPWAELWMGVHGEGPSEVFRQGAPLPLSALIKKNPEQYLGKETAEKFGGLPFLFKLLAAEKPLSIQAHPNKKQAGEGWEKENALGIPADAPERNYRDKNPKNEIIAAIDPFTALCGFREPEEIIELLEKFGALGTAPGDAPLKEQLAALGETLWNDSPAEGLQAFLRCLFELSPEIHHALGDYALENREALTEKYGELRLEWDLIASLAASYPGDPAIIAPLYLNLVHLESGEAIYLDTGVPHAYVRGFGAELMTNSDNVLRGGLTNKHIDLKELFSVLNFSPFKPVILKSPLPDPACFTYPLTCGEFSLSLVCGRGEETRLSGEGPLILVLVSGEAEISAGEENLHLTPGESVFVAAGDDISLRGNYTIYAAGTAPQP